ncbi:SPOSA6832_03699, partial [Sporobolomyces salmonicolor]
MVVYGSPSRVPSLYIYDRHCTCCFYADPSSSARPKPPGPSTLPNVLPPAPPSSDLARLSASSPGVGSELSGPTAAGAGRIAGAAAAQEQPASRGRLAFDEEAKLVYGVVFSLRNMVKKLSSRSVLSLLSLAPPETPLTGPRMNPSEDESFHSFSTSAYKLHYLRTSTSFHFVLVTSPTSTSLRPLLRQVYTGPFTEFIVRNPLAELDTASGRRGIDNAAFRQAVEKLIATV